MSMGSIYLIDYYANTIKSVFHRRTIAAKLIFLLLILFSIIITKSLLNLFLIFLILLLFIITAKLPFLKILKWSLYPAFFAVLFALSQIHYGLLPLKTIFRAVDAALLMLFIVCTTPYPALFSPISKISVTLANVFFLAYRYFFLIIDEMQTKTKMMKIRGGYAGGAIRTLQNIGSLVGRLFIHSAERSEILYNILIVRGYKGILSSKARYKFKLFDLLLIVAGAAVMVFAVI